MQQGGVHEHVVQNQKIAEEPGLVPARGGYRTWSCREHTLVSAERRRTPHPNGSGRVADLRLPGTKLRVRDGVGMSRATPAQASGQTS